MYAALVLRTWPMRMPHPQEMRDGGKMTAAGFEPTQPGLVELESTPFRPLGQTVDGRECKLADDMRIPFGYRRT